jgi:hypothetical protein
VQTQKEQEKKENSNWSIWEKLLGIWEVRIFYWKKIWSREKDLLILVEFRKKPNLDQDGDTVKDVTEICTSKEKKGFNKTKMAKIPLKLYQTCKKNKNRVNINTSIFIKKDLNTNQNKIVIWIKWRVEG